MKQTVTAGVMVPHPPIILPNIGRGEEKKIQDIFPEESICKTSLQYNIFAGVNLPSFIKDWLIKRYSDERGNVDKEALFAFLEKHIPAKDQGVH